MHRTGNISQLRLWETPHDRPTTGSPNLCIRIYNQRTSTPTLHFTKRKKICSLLGTARTMILPWRHCTRLYGGESLEWEIKNQAMLTLHARTCCVQRIDKKDGTYRANPCQHSDAMAQKIGWCWESKSRKGRGLYISEKCLRRVAVLDGNVLKDMFESTNLQHKSYRLLKSTHLCLLVRDCFLPITTSGIRKPLSK